LLHITSRHSTLHAGSPSHSSPESFTRSPQLGFVQLERQASGVWSLFAAPSSHASSDSTLPLPQPGGLGGGGGVVGIAVALVDPVGIGVGMTGGSSASAAPKREISHPPVESPRMKSESARRTRRLFHPTCRKISSSGVRTVVTRRHE
jgi:hypothetical protein